MSIAKSIVQEISSGRRIWEHILKYDPVTIYSNNFDGGKDFWKDLNAGQGAVTAVASFDGRSNVILNSQTSPRTNRLGSIGTGNTPCRVRGKCHIVSGTVDGLGLTNQNPNNKVWQDIQGNPPVGEWFDFDLVGNLYVSTGDVPVICPINGDTMSTNIGGIYFDNILIEQLQP